MEVRSRITSKRKTKDRLSDDEEEYDRFMKFMKEDQSPSEGHSSMEEFLRETTISSDDLFFKEQDPILETRFERAARRESHQQKPSAVSFAMIQEPNINNARILPRAPQESPSLYQPVLIQRLNSDTHPIEPIRSSIPIDIRRLNSPFTFSTKKPSIESSPRYISRSATTQIDPISNLVINPSNPLSNPLPMNTILSSQEIAIKCPLCDTDGLSELRLFSHVLRHHSKRDSPSPVGGVCTICSSVASRRPPVPSEIGVNPGKVEESTADTQNEFYKSDLIEHLREQHNPLQLSTRLGNPASVTRHPVEVIRAQRGATTPDVPPELSMMGSAGVRIRHRRQQQDKDLPDLMWDLVLALDIPHFTKEPPQITTMDCNKCSVVLSVSDTRAVLSCHHVFHVDCLSLTEPMPKCPTCKRDRPHKKKHKKKRKIPVTLKEDPHVNIATK